ncbi:unnamed protein product, partial [Ixodes pacificus]
MPSSGVVAILRKFEETSGRLFSGVAGDQLQQPGVRLAVRGRGGERRGEEGPAPGGLAGGVPGRPGPPPGGPPPGLGPPPKGRPSRHPRAAPGEQDAKRPEFRARPCHPAVTGRDGVPAFRSLFVSSVKCRRPFFTARFQVVAPNRCRRFVDKRRSGRNEGNANTKRNLRPVSRRLVPTP